MNAIGINNNFYVLWEVSNSILVSGSKKYDVTDYKYVKRISKNVENVSKLYPGFVVNDMLSGRHHSFKISHRIYDNIDTFRFGKYADQPIINCNDFHYLEWYINCEYNVYDDHRNFIANYLLTNGYQLSKNSDGKYELISPEKIESEIFTEIASYHASKDLDNKDTLVILSTKNLDSHGYLKNNGIFYSFRNFKTYCYEGFIYGLPIFKGKAKRIKNKKIIIDKFNYSINDKYEIIVDVMNFKIENN